MAKNDSMKNYIVLGGGISGCTAAHSLAEAGNSVTILERSSIAGGKVLDYCCKATDSCSRCGVCVAHTEIHDALSHPGVTLVTGAEVTDTGFHGSSSAKQKERTLQVRRRFPFIDYKACEFCGDCVSACPENCISVYRRGELVQYRIDYDKCLLHRGKSCSACMDACDAGAIQGTKPEAVTSLTAHDVLIATGHTPFDPAQKPRYGYSRSEKIITGAEAEARLTGEMDLGEAKSIAFIQCVGSRDPVIGRNYCSAVCCSYAMRLARIIKYRQPDIDVTIYYIDLQNFDKEFTLLKGEIEEMGVQFRRGLPFRIDELANGKLRFMIEDTAPEAAESGSEDTIVEHDLAVLSVGMGPDPSAAETASLFSIEQDSTGFFVSGDEPFFTIGTCREPQSMVESMAEAKSAALQMLEDRHE